MTFFYYNKKKYLIKMVQYYNQDNQIQHQLPPKSKNKLRICLISDTHETHLKLTKKIPPCDILIHTGDIFMTGKYRSRSTSIRKLQEFNEWTKTLPAKRVILIGGNHDFILERLSKNQMELLLDNIIYLQNSTVSFHNFHFIGCPFSSGISGNNTFQSQSFKDQSDRFIQKCSREFHENIVLLTHDYIKSYKEQLNPVLYVVGHNHFAGGISMVDDTIKVNATSVNVNYELSNEPIVLDLPRKRSTQQQQQESTYELSANISESI
jgi:Icc-related predicted phosphoesterase